MKTPIMNQPSLKKTRMRKRLKYASAITMGSFAVLLPGMVAANGGQEADASVQFRPIEEYIEAQGTVPFVAPQDASGAWTSRNTMRFAIVDYCGFANRWIEEQSGGAISLGTTVEGAVLERPLADGRAEVTVMLHAKNALTWVAQWVEGNIPPIGQPLFGHFADEVLQGASPALGEASMKWVFINAAPGAPLPDLMAEALLGPTVETKLVSIEAHADGSLREAFGVADGTPGRAQVIQTGLLFPPGIDATLVDGKWPAEHINLKVVGR